MADNLSAESSKTTIFIDNFSVHSNKTDYVNSPSKKNLLNSSKTDSNKTITNEKSPGNKLPRSLSLRDGMTVSSKSGEGSTKTSASFSEMFSNADACDYVHMTLGTLGGIATGLSLPLFNVLFGRMLDALNDPGTSYSKVIGDLCLAFIGIALGNLLSGFLQVYCWTTTGEKQSQKFREQYVTAILSQEIGWFDVCGAGELSTKVAELSGKLQDGMGRKVGDLVQYLAQVIGSFVVGFYLCWKLTVVLLAAFPLIAISGAFMISAITSFQNQSIGQYAAAGGLATESLGAIRTVTALNAQPDVISRYRVFLFKAMQVGIIKGFKVGLGNGSVFGSCFLTYALGFWYGAKLVSESVNSGCSVSQKGSDCITGGIVMAVFFSVIMGSIALGQLAPPLTAFFSAKAAVGSMMDILRRKPLIDGFSEEGEVPEQKASGAIELKDVEFAYPTRPDLTVCREYNLSVAPGETVALVGASGCGKSTIINLLLRFYDPDSGEVCLDGKNIRSLNIKWLRSQIGYVGQEPVLFAGTIGENIAYGLDPDLKSSISHKILTKEELMARVIEAAKLANAHDFISEFPQGYETDVGSNGVAMSGGQKQRIAIARALIKKPAVLLLDEATSALDATSEKIVQQSIDELQKRKAQTTIVIAHRLGTIRNADKICLISGGQIAEMGTHDALFAQNGLYADLVRLQMQAHDDDEPSPMKVSPSGNNLILEEVAIQNEVRKVSDASPLVATEEALVEKKPDELSKEESKKVSGKIWGLLGKHPIWLTLGCLGAAVFGAIFPVWGLLLANTQNMFYLTDTDEMQRQANMIAIYYIIMSCGAFISSTFQFWGIAQVGERVSSRLRSDMFEAIMRREIAFFDNEENSIGTLTTRLSDDSRTVNKAFGEALAKQLQAMFTLLIGLGLGFSASWQIAFVVLATFPINIAASAIQMQAIAGQQYENEEAPVADTTKGNKEGGDQNNKSNSSTPKGHGSVISTAFTHMRTVSAFSMQHKVAEHYTSLTKALSDNRSKRSVVGGLGFGGSQTALFLTYALLFWYGSTLISAGTVTFQDMMTAILTLMLGALGLGQAMSDLGDQKLGIKVAAKIFQSIEDGKNSPIDGLSHEGIIQTTRASGKIELKNVTFRYPTRPDVEVCKGYTLSIEPGEMVALVGPSGSGKSTIINLLLRFYDPLSGDITLDGVNIKDLNVRWLRSQIGYVGQEPVLFTGSVADNVSKGRVSMGNTDLLSLEDAMKIADETSDAYYCFPGSKANVPSKSTYGNIEGGDIEMAEIAAADEDIVNACKASHAHDFVSTFPQGYQTDVGEGSIMVSGGQKQRIAIARALIKKPAVLLLDEATSALDANSERIVQESIDALQALKEQTTIVIAHRLSTIRNADKIIVVDKGVVVETGTHNELLNNQGLYHQLWNKQSGGDKSNENK